MIGRRRAERTTHRAGTGRTTTYREYGAVGRRTGWAPTRPVKLDSDQLPNIDDFWVSDQPLRMFCLYPPSFTRAVSPPPPLGSLWSLFHWCCFLLFQILLTVFFRFFFPCFSSLVCLRRLFLLRLVPGVNNVVTEL